MPQKGCSKRTLRECLICAETTTIAHLGLDVCRACAVFHRRSRHGKQLKCRSNTGSCTVGKGLNCKRCRFEHLERLLQRTGSSTEIPDDQSGVELKEEQQPQSSSSEIPPADVAHPRQHSGLLERLRAHYKSFCNTRLNSELNARKVPPHPLEISLEKGPFFPANLASFTAASRIALTAILQFGAEVFPEYADLPNTDKWSIALNFFYRFRIFENCYRSARIFPDHESRYFGTFTTYIDGTLMGDFLEGAEPGADLEGAMKFVQGKMFNFRDNVTSGRATITRLNPCHEEFITVAALMFWSIEGAPVTEQITFLAEKYRKEVLSELHAFYRDEKRLDNYATRLGELMMFLQYFERSAEVKQSFEMLRLLNVLSEDSFIYQIKQDGNF